jgi:hypothetical protein
MLRSHPTTMKRCLGIGAVLQGAFVIGVSVVTLPAALRVAEVLYAEDFDRSGVVPRWFGPWYLAIWHPYVATVVFLIGTALVVTGIRFTNRGLGAQVWFERVLLSAMICCLILAVALIPLSNTGSDWASGTPAYDLRRTLIASTVAVWLELVLLLTTMVIVKRTRGYFP